MPAHPPLIDNKQSGDNTSVPRLETIGVIGAGVMGVGMAHALAQSGLRTLLIDVSDSILQSALGQIRNNIRFQRLFHKNQGSG
ncbi:MAG: 3-hydroxyacyl-CoA dehydrogenase NAD-binding domain-containing protein, partial [Candidatus Angelobacter sp.]